MTMQGLPTEWTPEWVDEMQRRIARAGEIRNDLVQADPTLPDVTAIVMSQDLEAAQRVRAAVVAGELTFDQAWTAFGSYARMTGMLALHEDGYGTRDQLLDGWAAAWPHADPIDNDPRLIDVWRALAGREGHIVLDNAESVWPPEPRGETGTLSDDRRYSDAPPIRVYRGQPKGAKLGCSWSLREDVADRFARGAWARTPLTNGEVHHLDIDPMDPGVIAYLTDRGEDEVIIDPAVIKLVTVDVRGPLSIRAYGMTGGPR